MINYTPTAACSFSLPLSKARVITLNAIRRSQWTCVACVCVCVCVCVCTVCVLVSGWWVGWGPWLLTLSLGVRQQTAGQLDISISKTPEDPSALSLHTHTHTHTQTHTHAHSSKFPSLLSLVSHFLLLWMVGWFMSAEELQPFISL